MILAAVAVGSEREHELLAVSRTLYHCPRVLKYVLTADCVAVFHCQCDDTSACSPHQDGETAFGGSST